MKPIALSLFITIVFSINVKSQPETIWQLLQNGSIVRWAYSGGDEFNGTELDNLKWMDSYPWGRSLVGQEQQYYKEGGDNIILENGLLKLITKYEPGHYTVIPYQNPGDILSDGQPNFRYLSYTSGMIFSKHKYKYGLFEIRFKAPVGKGLWPAFWLYAGHKKDEIDIFEMKGEKPKRFKSGVICDNDDNGTNDCGGEWFTANGNFSNGFNVMMGEWGPNSIIWYLNGSEYKIFLHSFNYSMWLIANTAVALDCPDPDKEYEDSFCTGPDGSTPFPASFEIDYIRVWTQLDCQSDVTISNYNQSPTDATVITGGNINASNLQLSEEKSLKLIATNDIIIEPNTIIEGEFEAKIVNCPGPGKKDNNPDLLNGSLQINLENDSAVSFSAKNPIDLNIAEKTPIFVAKIYPNPAEGMIILEFTGVTERSIKIELINSKGQSVFSKEYLGESKLEINTSNMPKGIYILKGTFGNNSVTEKITIN